MGIFDNVYLEDCFVLEGEYTGGKYGKQGNMHGIRHQVGKGDGFTAKQEVLKNPKYGEKKVLSKTDNSETYRMIPKKDMDKDTKREYKSEVKDKKNEYKYAAKATKNIDKKYGRDSEEAQSAKDAARRHYRKTMKEALDMLAAIDYDYNG